MARQKRKTDDAAVPKILTAWQKIAEACEGRLRRKILAGEVPIQAKKLMTISRTAPPMRRAQAKSYAATGRPLELPRYRDVVDGLTEAIRNEGVDITSRGGEGLAAALAQALDTRTRIDTPAGVIDVPPLDTEEVSELLNRLDRALGLVAKVVVDLPRLYGATPTGVEEAALRERLGSITAFAGLVELLLRRPMASASAALKRLPGTYVVLLHLHEGARFPRVGPFGVLELREGWYTYVGSGGVMSRVGHHAVRDKAHLHWHLDYVRPAMVIEEVWCTYDRVRRECSWAKLVYESLGGTVPVPGFGSADCKKFRAPLRCEAHFCHFRRRPSWEAFSEAARRAMPEHAFIEVVDGRAVSARADCRHGRA